jgi:hypothetical protein
MDSLDQPEQSHQRQPQVWLFASGVLATILVIAGGFFVYQHFLSDKPANKNQQQINPLFSYKGKAGHPLYYAKQLPAGFTLKPGSASQEEGVVFYSYDYNDKEIIVTQQPKPKMMERVKKIKEFDTPIGKAYLADLEGRITGFIETDKTLVILNNAATDDKLVLEELMHSFSPV